MERDWQGFWRTFDDCVAQIHGAPTIDAMRERVMEAVPALIPHDYSFFDHCTCSGGHIQFHSPVTYGLSPADTMAYYDRYASTDYVVWAYTTDRPLVFRDSDLVTDDSRKHTPVYREWMEPLGIYYAAGCTIVGNDTIYGTLTLFRGQGAGDFTDDEMEVLRRLDVHFIQRYVAEDARRAGLPVHLSGLGEVKAHYLLTPREGELLELMNAGLANAEISARLCISESTTKKHINNLYRKMGVRGRAQLMRLLYQVTSTSVG